MKTIIILILVIFLSSCGDRLTNSYTNLGALLSDCRGYGVVVTTGVNEGNFKEYKYSLVIKDSTVFCREYFGAEMDVKIGDTLINKQK